jgi:putative oxygen-independent coproporphyrinogen III oxidase
VPVSLYFHLPFCRRLCPYCDFFKKVPRQGDLERISSLILSELSATLTREKSSAEGPLTSVYFGGGTPSLHSREQLEALLGGVSPLGDVSACEVTLEANPGTLTLNSLQELRRVGINRLSLGCQSFSDRKLHLLYRDHTADETRATVKNARQAGFTNISMDLIFGLPGETRDEWLSDMDQLLACEPDHVSLYNLEYHEQTPYGRWLTQGVLEPLQEDFEAELYMLTHAKLEQAGYEHYEVSNFSRAGFRSIHNQVYWEGKPYLGVGPSAHSFDGVARRFANVADLHEYERRVLRRRIVRGSRMAKQRARTMGRVDFGETQTEGRDFVGRLSRSMGRHARQRVVGCRDEFASSSARCDRECFSANPGGVVCGERGLAESLREGVRFPYASEIGVTEESSNVFDNLISWVNRDKPATGSRFVKIISENS